MDDSELQKKYFAILRDKYQVGQYKSAASDSFLYLILRKAELGIQITNIEFQWLAENRLFKPIEMIYLQQYKAADQKRLEGELLQLQSKYHIPEELQLPITSPVCSVLWKLDAGFTLRDSELDLLNNHNLVDTIILVQDILNFSNLKVQYKATKHLTQFPDEPLYSILKKLDSKEQLTEFEADWLLNLDFEETLEIYWQQEDERKAIIEFSDLKTRHHLNSLLDTPISSPLYPILKKLKHKKELNDSECEWLEQQKLTNLIAIDRNRKDIKLFKELKIRYKAIQYQATDSSNKLFLILKNIESQITEENIQWLVDEGLLETAEIAKVFHFRILKTKYQIIGQLASNPFYEIMLKLEREERLDPKQVVQLIEENRLFRHGRIAIAYYKLEAVFYEKEYQRTGNKWNLPSASSNWRKANEPEKALKITENVNWNKVQESELKSALWVTRGAAFRDLAQLDEAENCAVQAIECQPDSHQPYTLMGAICYDRCEYVAGDNWFEMAAERGADDMDDEIERIVRMTKDKDKRKEVAEYLLQKNPSRYSWANSYVK